VSVGSASPDLPGRPGEWLVASDLDQTLIFSRRRCALNPDVAVTPVEDLDGQPISFSTPRSLRLLAALTETATFVPVTTRTRAQFARVRLGLAAPLAITTNGGALLVDGQPDEEWTAGVHERIAACARPVAAVAALARQLAEQDWVRVTKVADGLFVYLVAHDREGIPDLAGLAASLAGDGWRLSVQGRKVYLVPAVLTKEAAVAEAMRRAGSSRLAAAGDSLLDAGLLAQADVAVRPAHGELHEQGWTRPGLLITDSAGPAAGEQIAELLTVTVGAPVPPEPATAGPATVGPATVGPATVGPATVGPATAGPATVGPGRATITATAALDQASRPAPAESTASG